MNPRHPHVIERFNLAPHHLRRHSRFFRDRNVRRARCNHQNMALEPLLGIANRYDARLVMIDGSLIQPFDQCRHLASRARGQQGAMMLQQGLGNGANLSRRLPLAENHFGESLPYRPMVIERREPQIFIGQGAELIERRGHWQSAGLHLGQESFKRLLVHACPFSGFASRSIRSATAWRQDFPSNNTSLISRTIGISTPWR